MTDQRYRAQRKDNRRHIEPPLTLAVQSIDAIESHGGPVIHRDGRAQIHRALSGRREPLDCRRASLWIERAAAPDRRRHRPPIVDRGAFDDDLRLDPCALRGNPCRTPARQDADAVETAGERRIVGIFVRLEPRRHVQGLIVVRIDDDLHRARDGDVGMPYFLKLRAERARICIHADHHRGFGGQYRTALAAVPWPSRECYHRAMRARLLAYAAALASLLALPSSAQDVIHLKAHHLMPPVAFGHSAMMAPWAEMVEQAADGRLEIDIYPSMHLGGQPPALIDQVREGVVDIVWTLPGYTPGRFPRIEVFELPFLNAHPIVTNFAIQEFIENHPEEFAEYKVISAFVHAGQLIHSKVPIRSVEDFAGQKIRIPTRVAGWMVDSWGAVPVGTPVSKIPEMLSKGIVDSTLIPFEAAFGLKVHDLVDYNIFLDDPRSARFNAQVLILAMNKNSYSSLPASSQKAIDDHSGRNIARWIGEVWINAEEPGRRAALESGEFIYLPPAEVEKLRARSERAVADRWIAAVARKGIDGRPLIAEARELIEKYERQLGRDAGLSAPSDTAQ